MCTTIQTGLRCAGDFGVAGGACTLQEYLVIRNAPEMLPQASVPRAGTVSIPTLQHHRALGSHLCPPLHSHTQNRSLFLENKAERTHPIVKLPIHWGVTLGMRTQTRGPSAWVSSSVPKPPRPAHTMHQPSMRHCLCHQVPPGWLVALSTLEVQTQQQTQAGGDTSWLPEGMWALLWARAGTQI